MSFAWQRKFISFSDTVTCLDMKNNKVICFFREIEFSLNKFVQLEMSAFKRIQWNLNHANLTPSRVHQAPSQSPSGNGVTLLWQRHNHSYLNHFLHNLIFMCGAALAVSQGHGNNSLDICFVCCCRCCSPWQLKYPLIYSTLFLPLLRLLPLSKHAPTHEEIFRLCLFIMSLYYFLFMCRFWRRHGCRASFSVECFSALITVI